MIHVRFRLPFDVGAMKERQSAKNRGSREQSGSHSARIVRRFCETPTEFGRRLTQTPYKPKRAGLISASVSATRLRMQIYIGKNGQQLGPFSLEEVNRKLADGTFTGADLAWYEGAAGWAPLAGVPGV